MKGYGVGEKFSQDPIGSNESRGKNREQRKHRNDPGWTPTEEHIRNRLMRQFMKSPEGTESSDASAYKSASCWCECGRGLKDSHGLCSKCRAMYPLFDLTPEVIAASSDEATAFIHIPPAAWWVPLTVMQ